MLLRQPSTISKLRNPRKKTRPSPAAASVAADAEFRNPPAAPAARHLLSSGFCSGPCPSPLLSPGIPSRQDRHFWRQLPATTSEILTPASGTKPGWVTPPSPHLLTIQRAPSGTPAPISCTVRLSVRRRTHLSAPPGTQPKKAALRRFMQRIPRASDGRLPPRSGSATIYSCSELNRRNLRSRRKRVGRSSHGCEPQRNNNHLSHLSMFPFYLFLAPCTSARVFYTYYTPSQAEFVKKRSFFL